MESQFKKLLNDSIEDTISKSCAQYCQPEKNQLGFCPPICIPYCYPTCYRSFLAGIQPDVVAKPLNNNHDEENQHKPPPLALVTLLLILLIVLSIFLCYTINKFCKSWHDSRTEPPEPQSREGRGPRGDDLELELEVEVDHPIWYIRSVGLEPSVISSITIWKYKKGDGVVEGTDCVVCLNEFQEDETIRILPKCNHAFHIPCIDKWLRSHTNCPMCRAGIVITPVGLPSPEQNRGNSGILEEISQEGVSENETERENNEVQGDLQDESVFKHGLTAFAAPSGPEILEMDR